MARSPVLSAALAYAARGWSVIALHGIAGGKCTCGNVACASPGKHPIGKWKHRQDVRAELSELTALFNSHPDANVGIVTGEVSGLAVVDVDNPALFENEPVMRRLVPEFKGPTVVTGRNGGGFHLYFAHPGFRTGNFAKRLPGLDGRGDGGYVVAPPSRHISGAQYSFAEGFGPANALPALPAELAAMFEGGSDREGASTAYGRKALASELERVRSAQNGERNNVLNSAAFNLGQLCQQGELARSAVAFELVRAGTDVGLSTEEAERTTASGLDGGEANPRRPKEEWAQAGAGEEKKTAPFATLDMSILHGTRSAPPEFPVAVLGDRLARWCRDAARGAGAPVDYLAGTLLCVSSSLIGNARRVAAHRQWVEPAHLWVMLVGDPSAGKTPGIKAVLKYLDPLERERRRDFDSANVEYERAKELADEAEDRWRKACKVARDRNEPEPEWPVEANAPKAPALVRLMVNDATREALALVSQANPKGILFMRDELSGWMADFNRYGGDGARQDWLMAYNGDQYRVDRVKHPVPVLIPHWSVAVFGGIQPERLVQALIREVDDGLSARFLYLWPDPVPAEWPPEIELEPIMEMTFRRLFAFLRMVETEEGDARPVVLPLSQDAVKVFADWRQQHAAAQPVGLLLKGHFGKMPGLVLRLALTLEYLRWSVDDMPGQASMTFGDTISEVSRVSIEAAIHLMEVYFKPMARRVFQDAETPEGDRDAPALARWIVQNRVERFNASQARNKAGIPSGLRDATKMNRACEALRDRGWLRFVGERNDGRAGRKSLDWEVNPAVQDEMN